MSEEEKREEQAEEISEEAPAEAAGESAEAAPETFTVTREQMEKMEAAAKALSEQQDKFLRLAAEYDNYR